MADRGLERGGYRYNLERELSPASAGAIMFIMLNPSTATETEDDPTIRRCIGFANRLGYGKLYIGNLFGMRATNPKNLKLAADPVGRGNNQALREMASYTTDIVAAWGNHGGLYGRDRDVLRMFHETHRILCLGDPTLKGFPRHPLYMANDCYIHEYESQRWET